MGLKEPNFRVARQPPTIVTWTELHFYDLPLIRPSGFLNSAALGRSDVVSDPVSVDASWLFHKEL